MRFIVHQEGGYTYCYYESEKQFAKNEQGRATWLKKLTRKDLADECDLGHYGDCYHVVKVPTGTPSGKKKVARRNEIPRQSEQQYVLSRNWFI